MKKLTLVAGLIWLACGQLSAQNVGIGTTSPAAKLHVTGGDLRIDAIAGTGYRNIYANANGDIVSSIGASDVDPNWLSTGNANINDAVHFIGTTNSSDLVFKTNNIEGMRMDAAGSLGIGTNNPAEKLHVAGNIRIDNLSGGSTKIVYADADGKLTTSVGVGLASLSWETTGNANTTPATHYLGTTDAQPLVVKTNGLERVRVLSNGNVGINTNSPTASLDVNGSMLVNGSISVKTTTVVAGATASTLSSDDYVVFVNRATVLLSDVVNLPTAAASLTGRIMIVSNVGAEDIDLYDGVTVLESVKNDKSVTVICDGTSWIAIGKY